MPVRLKIVENIRATSPWSHGAGIPSRIIRPSGVWPIRFATLLRRMLPGPSELERRHVLNLQRGDHVRLKSENLDGVVVDVKTRSVVVRIQKATGETHERHVSADDLERVPTTKEAVLEAPRAHRAPITPFAIGSAPFIVIDDAHVREDRIDGWLTSLRTMYGNLHDEGLLHSVSLVGVHGRRVLTISSISGHAVFHKMQNAWDQHKMRAERHDIPENRTLDMFHATQTVGEATIDDQDAYTYVFVSVKAPAVAMPPFTASANAILNGRTKLASFEGGALFANDDDSHEVLFTRWSGRGAAEAFVQDARHHIVLPPTAQLGDEAEAYEPKEQLVP